MKKTMYMYIVMGFLTGLLALLVLGMFRILLTAAEDPSLALPWLRGSINGIAFLMLYIPFLLGGIQVFFVFRLVRALWRDSLHSPKLIHITFGYHVFLIACITAIGVYLLISSIIFAPLVLFFAPAMGAYLVAILIMWITFWWHIKKRLGRKK